MDGGRITEDEMVLVEGALRYQAAQCGLQKDEAARAHSPARAGRFANEESRFERAAIRVSITPSSDGLGSLTADEMSAVAEAVAEARDAARRDGALAAGDGTRSSAALGRRLAVLVAAYDALIPKVAATADGKTTKA